MLTDNNKLVGGFARFAGQYLNANLFLGIQGHDAETQSIRGIDVEVHRLPPVSQ